MIPYGGNPVKPPSYRVDPPSPGERQRDRRFALLLILFIAGALCLLADDLLPSGVLFASWLAVKLLWKDPYA